MNVTIQPSAISGQIHAAASKSAMQRACALALLHEAPCTIHNAGHSNDDKAALGIIAAMGAQIEAIDNNSLRINSRFLQPGNAPTQIFCGESGLSIRMFTPIAALLPRQLTITGSGSLLSRPMHFFDKVLPGIGVAVQSNNGLLPLHITGPLQAHEITIDGSLSSQFLTGLLFAFARAAKKPVNIQVHNLKSTPYIDLSLHMLQHFGYKVSHTHYQQFTIAPYTTGNAQPVTYTVEGDWSGAAFLLVAGAIAGGLQVTGLDPFSTQADKAILTALSLAGAALSIQPNQIDVGPGALKAFQFDATHCPDLFPPLVALAAYCQGTTVIEGALRLTHKESNRALTLQEEFGKMGVVIKLQDDLMIVEGSAQLKGANVHSHHDHRIAMALAIAGLKANGNTVIANADAINKSYPDFYAHIAALGASLQYGQ